MTLKIGLQSHERQLISRYCSLVGTMDSHLTKLFALSGISKLQRHKYSPQSLHPLRDVTEEDLDQHRYLEWADKSTVHTVVSRLPWSNGGKCCHANQTTSMIEETMLAVLLNEL